MKWVVKTFKNILRDWRGYGVAVILVAAATFLKRLAEPDVIPANVPILYLLAIVPTATFFGLGPSILVCLLSVVAFNYFFMSQAPGFDFFDIATTPILLIFLFVGITFSLLASNLRKKNLVVLQELASRKQIETELVNYQSQLEEAVAQRTSELVEANRELASEVAERRVAQDDLVKEKNYIQTILDTAQTIILSLDTQGRIVYFNVYMQEISGYSLEEVEGKDWFKTFLPEREQPKIKDLFQSSLENIQTRGNINSIITKEGRERFIEWNNTVLKNADGVVVGVLASGQDITERLIAEETLRTTREQVELDRKRLQTLLETIPAAVVVIEQGTLQFTLINQRAAKIYGTDYLGVDLKNHVEKVRVLRPDGSDFPLEEMPVTHSLNNGEYIHNVEMSIENAEGKRIPVLASTAPLFDARGNIRAAAVVFIDISERKQAETVLLKEKNKARQYWNLAGTMLIAIDINGNVTDVNKKGCEILGYKENEIIGKNWYENFIPEASRERLRAGLREIVTGKPRSFKQSGNFSIITKGGKEKLISWHNSLIRDEDGSIIGTMSSGEDITDRKKMEEELQKIEKLESIGTLAGGIAHDFNNILTAILGNISLAMAQSREHTPLFSVLQEAEKASLRARELTLQLLTFSRGGAPVKKTVSLAELIRESSSFALRGSKVKGEFALDTDLWDVEADEGQINQVLHNLVKNAVEAMPDGGVAHISAVNKIVAESVNMPLAPGKYVQISVTDSGTGISKNNLERMFEPFFTTKPKGSGLGLATSYSIIKNHGGFIDLESEEGKGATFNVYLPASEKHAADKKETITHHTIKGKGKILVMDDEEMILTMLGSILKVSGYTSVPVSDGAEAVRQYVNALKSKEPFDAVIMDLTIPGGMGGKEAILKLLEKDPDVKVIVSSGYATDPIMAEYEDYGFSAVVTKPYTAEQIEKTLHNLLKKKK